MSKDMTQAGEFVDESSLRYFLVWYSYQAVVVASQKEIIAGQAMAGQKRRVAGRGMLEAIKKDGKYLNRFDLERTIRNSGQYEVVTIDEIKEVTKEDYEEWKRIPDWLQEKIDESKK